MVTDAGTCVCVCVRERRKEISTMCRYFPLGLPVLKAGGGAVGRTSTKCAPPSTCVCVRLGLSPESLTTPVPTAWRSLPPSLPQALFTCCSDTAALLFDCNTHP